MKTSRILITLTAVLTVFLVVLIPFSALASTSCENKGAAYSNASLACQTCASGENVANGTGCNFTAGGGLWFCECSQNRNCTDSGNTFENQTVESTAGGECNGV